MDGTRRRSPRGGATRSRRSGVPFLAVLGWFLLPQCTSPLESISRTATVEEGSRPAQPVPLPERRHGHGLERLRDGTLLVFGGFSRRKDAAHRGQLEVWALPPGRTTWERRADLPRAHAFAGSVQKEGFVYLLGDSVLRYDPERDTWQELAPSGSLPRSHFGCALYRGAAYVVGGVGERANGLLRVDLETGEVSAQEAMPGYERGEHFHLVATFGDTLHVIGGLGESGPLTSHHAWDGTRWTLRAPAPVGLWAKFAVAASTDETFHVFTEAGGFRYVASENAWYEQPRLPKDLVGDYLAMPASWIAGETLFVLGGQPARNVSPLLLAFDLRERRWRVLSETLTLSAWKIAPGKIFQANPPRRLFPCRDQG